MAPFYRCLFFYPGVFGLAYLILLKQLSQEDLEAKLLKGGLSKISPMALMNFLRIFMLRLKDFRWKNGEIDQNIPVTVHAQTIKATHQIIISRNA